METSMEDKNKSSGGENYFVNRYGNSIKNLYAGRNKCEIHA